MPHKQRLILEIFNEPSKEFASSLYTFLGRYVLKNLQGKVILDQDIYYREDYYNDEIPDIIFGLYDKIQDRIVGAYAFGSEALYYAMNFYNGDFEEFDETDYILALAFYNVFREMYFHSISRLIEQEEESEPEGSNSESFPLEVEQRKGD